MLSKLDSVPSFLSDNLLHSFYLLLHIFFKFLISFEKKFGEFQTVEFRGLVIKFVKLEGILKSFPNIEDLCILKCFRNLLGLVWGQLCNDSFIIYDLPQDIIYKLVTIY